MKSPKTSHLVRVQGFTFIELLIVVTVASLIMAGGVTLSFSSVSRSAVIEERDLLVSFLVTARARAISGINDKSHGVHVSKEAYTIFEADTGEDFDDPGRDTDNDQEYLRSEKTKSAVIVDPEETDIIFGRLSGDVSTGMGTITITQGESEQAIDINQVGRIDW